MRKVENLPFGGVLTNFAPIEIDANAAAAQFAWSRHPEAVDELLAGGVASRSMSRCSVTEGGRSR